MPSVEDRVALNDHLHEVATQEAVTRAAESRAQVLMNKAATNERFRDHAEDAITTVREHQDRLDELNDITANWGQDLEGTRATLSDKSGNFARNARVARAGGTHIEGSNSVDGGDEPADDPEEAGSDPVVGATVITGRGGQGETLTGQSVLPVSNDDEDADETPARKRGSKAARRRAAKEPANDAAE